MKLKKYYLIAICLSIFNISQANCLFTASNLNFGVYQSPYQRSDVLSRSMIGVTCDNQSMGNTLSIKLYQGQSPTFDRYLANAAEHLRYNLFLDSERTIVWGDGTGGTSIYNATLANNNTVNIFSSIYKNQNIAPGNYQDNIVFELSF